MAGQLSKPGGGAKRDARFIGDVPGSFVFLERTGQPWEGETFQFKARSVSTTKAVITTSVEVEKGERIALRFDAIGIRRGVVERPLKDGFTLTFTAETGAEPNVDARIGWLNRKVRGGAEDRRQYRRLLPKHADARLVLGASSYADCRIIDMSRSGAGLNADMHPPVGSLLAVGAIPARVVRHFEGGFAVRFLELQVESELEALLTLRTSSEKSLAAVRLGFAA